MNFILCKTNDCLRTTSDKNMSHNTSIKYFESLWNFSRPMTNFEPQQYKHCFCSNRNYRQTLNSSKECSFILDRSVLIHHPPPIPHLQNLPCLLMDEWLLHITPIHSVILTVWNQELIINETLNALLNYTREWWELIVVFDQCRDKSISTVESIIKTFINRCNQSTACPNPHLVHIRLINQISGVSETTSNNIGMRASHISTMYFILVQDDIIVRQDGWNCILAMPMRLWTDVFSVSGRCAHPHWNMNGGSFIGRCSTDIDFPLRMSCAERSAFYVRDTCNRGPLFLHAARTRLLGYLDEKNYWLGDDDHDLNFRAYASNRWVAGFQPIDFDAPLKFGGTRRKNAVPMTPEDIQYRKIRLAEAGRQLSAINKFKSQRWKHTNLTIELGADIPSVNFYNYMKDKKNIHDFTHSHAETRNISSNLLPCKE